MTAVETLIEEALEAWAYTRSGVVDEVASLGERDLAFRPAEGSRSVAELVFHILESGTLMSGELSRKDGDFRRKGYDALLREYGRGIRRVKTRRQLLDALRRTHEKGAEKIRRAGELHILQLIRRFDGRMGTRLAWMHHAISHEEYHRGQIALCARLLGRTPALTKLIEGSS